MITRNISFVAGLMLSMMLVSCSSSHDAATGTTSEAENASGKFEYSFDPSGLVTQVGTETASRAIVRQGDVLTAGAST